MNFCAPICAESTTATYNPARVASLMARRAYLAVSATARTWYRTWLVGACLVLRGHLAPGRTCPLRTRPEPGSGRVRLGHYPRMEALRAIDDWQAGTAAAGVARADGILATRG